MTIDISLENKVDNIVIKCSPVEFFVLDDALKMLADNRSLNEKYRLIASEMVKAIQRKGWIKE